MNKVREDLRVLTEELIYEPNPEQRKVKAAYWAVKGESLVSGAINQLTLSECLKVTGDSRLQRWWAEPGFQDWFANSNSFRQRLEYLADLALGTVEQILTDPDTNPNARINAAKLVFEAAEKLPKHKQEVKFADQMIAAMTPEQLKAFINKNAVKELKDGSESN